MTLVGQPHPWHLPPVQPGQTPWGESVPYPSHLIGKVDHSKDEQGGYLTTSASDRDLWGCTFKGRGNSIVSSILSGAVQLLALRGAVFEMSQSFSLFGRCALKGGGKKVPDSVR